MSRYACTVAIQLPMLYEGLTVNIFATVTDNNCIATIICCIISVPLS